MVTWNDPVILSVRREYKKTNKGIFWFTVVDLDCHFESGDRLVMSADRHLICAGNSVWSSSIGLGSGQYADYHTNAVSDDSKIEVSSRLATFGQRNLIDYGIKLNGNTAAAGYLDPTSYTAQGHFISVAGGCVYRDTNGNGVCYNTANIIGWFQNPPAPHSIRHNTADSFGLVVSTVTNNAITINIDNTALAAGYAYLDNSKSTVDPYEEGGYTDPEGDVDPPETDELPNVTPSDQPSNVNDMAAGLYRCYAMSSSELATFGAKLWKPSVLQALRNHIQQPLDIVMGLKSYPFELPGGTSEEIHFNWLDDVDPIWGSGVYGHPISGNGIKTLTFGHIDVPRASGTFYDYQPFSSAELHLPYIGFVPLKMNEIVGRSLIITYKVDLFSGDFTAWVTMGTTDDYDNNYNRKVYGYYQGNIAKAIPIMQNDMWRVYKKGVEIAFDSAKAIGSLATGSLARGAALAHAHQAETLITSGNPKTATTALEMAGEEYATSENMFTTFKRSGTDTINAAMDMSYVSSPIERNGVIDGNSGRTSSQQCFLMVTIPDQSVPDNQSILGFPSNIPGPLSKVSGYTEVREIRLHSGIASESELNELEGILRGGIVI